MNVQGPPTAKATVVEDQSDSIVVSFGSEWYRPIRDRKFNAVIRKRIPKTIEPKLLYFHVNAPVSAICARAGIISIRELKLGEVKNRTADLFLSSDEITNYFAGDSTIGCYELEDITFAKREVTMADLVGRLVYHPPQSFLILSLVAKRVIDKLGGFKTGGKEKL